MSVRIEELFFELLRVAIGNTVCLSHTPTDKEWKALYDMAKKQSLVGVCFAGIQRLQSHQQEPPEMLHLTWMGMAAKIQQRNEVINRHCVEVQRTIEKAGFRTYIMKGQGNAALYDGTLSVLRQSGDIDIFLEGGFNKVMKFVNDTYPTKDVNELEIHYHCLPDTEVEIHYKPFVMDCPKDRILQSFFTKCAEENFANKIILSTAGTICVPTIRFNLVHQMVHIMHHFFYGGVGMRQLMDYYFVVKHEIVVKRGASVREVKNVVYELGLDRFASALMWVLGHVFLLSEELMLWSPNEKDGKFLLNEILLSGNFGKMDERMKGIRENKLKSFFVINLKSVRLWRFDHWAWFWIPIYRIKGFIWKKYNGFN